MGSGSKFRIGFVPVVGLGFSINRFPHTISINITLICFQLYLGIGKGYDE